MRLTETQMQIRREIVIKNAVSLFCQKGIVKTKLTEIASRSHVSENTIYRYFGNKESLVTEAFLDMWDSIMTGVEQTVESTPEYFNLTGLDQIAVWLRGFQRLYQVDQEFVIFSYEAKLYLLRHKVKLEAYQQDIMMHAIRKPCLAALEKGKADGTITAAQDSVDLFYTIWGAIRGYVVKIVLYDNLYGDTNPWRDLYHTLEIGILCALSSGWHLPYLSGNGPPLNLT